VKPNIIFETPTPEEVSEKTLQSAAVQTFAAVKSEIIGNIHVVFTDEADSKRLNSQFAGNNYPTDVLSFVYETAQTTEELKLPQAKAEIVICTPIAQAQAKEYNISLQSELILLFVHGLLHVLDHDHQSETQKASFESLQDDIMVSLGLNTRKMKWLH
jgi:probable rRNA maturation factor